MSKEYRWLSRQGRRSLRGVGGGGGMGEVHLDGLSLQTFGRTPRRDGTHKSCMQAQA